MLLRSSNPDSSPVETYRDSFPALGTLWNISLCGGAPEHVHGVFREVRGFLEEFECRFSRFREESEVNSFRNAKRGTYAVSEELSHMLRRASRLRDLTDGSFDIGRSGHILETLGYGRVMNSGTNFAWGFEEGELCIDGPISIDVGGIGKGYAIDSVSSLLVTRGFCHHIVEGGGDIYASDTESHGAYRSALEWPGRPNIAVGIVEMQHRGLAVSDVFKRRWGAQHHIVDARREESPLTVIGCAAVAKSAFDADSATSALFLCDPLRYSEIAREFDAQFLVFRRDGTVIVSPNWDGELF